jgi:nucleotide-binding universal stress UspA family protein
MSFASMLFPMDLRPETSRALKIATQIADRYSAHLVGAAAYGAYPVVVQGVAVEQVFTAKEEGAIRDYLTKNETEFRDLTKHLSKPVLWRSDIRPRTDYFIEQSFIADLVIVPHQAGAIGAADGLDLGELILSAGRPVLVVPVALDRFRLETAIVAWKNTRECRRAMQDALPLLHDAERVILYSVCPEAEAERRKGELDDLQRYLLRHRINAAINMQIASDESAAECIMQTVEKDRVDLIVTGAYGHGRFEEWIFGGVTRELLRQNRVCCLMAH